MTVIVRRHTRIVPCDHEVECGHVHRRITHGYRITFEVDRYRAISQGGDDRTRL